MILMLRSNYILAIAVIFLFYEVQMQLETAVFLNAKRSRWIIQQFPCFDDKWKASITVNNVLFELKGIHDVLLVVLEIKNHKIIVNNYTISLSNSENTIKKINLTSYVPNNLQISKGSVLIFNAIDSEIFNCWIKKSRIIKNFRTVIRCVDPCAFESEPSFPFTLVNLSFTNYTIKFKGLQARSDMAFKTKNFALIGGLLTIAASLMLTIVVFCYKKKIIKVFFSKKAKSISDKITFKNLLTQQNVNESVNLAPTSNCSNTVEATSQYADIELQKHYVSIKKEDKKNTFYEEIQFCNVYDYASTEKDEKDVTNIYYLAT
ncbi:uncharacterized protein LOC136081749 [Hydra vulgaris]|uniref:Uncharacterized protein LOC136081749 n=1 Tax=Hydra vulgaris TaxID=6087 RepID=A0ABM4C2L1_HYDVU